MRMTPSQHEKNEWSRMAQAAYAADQNAVGHRFSGFASMPNGADLPVGVFDTLQSHYRAWLNFNEWPTYA